MFKSVLKTKVTSLVEETVKVGALVPQNVGLCSEGMVLDFGIIFKKKS